MNVEQGEFLNTFKNIKTAYNLAMSEVNKLREDRKPPRSQEEMNMLHEKCLRLIENVFEIPLTLPDNFDGIAEEWSAICLMVQRLTDIKSDLLHQFEDDDQSVCESANKSWKGTLCTALAVIAGGAALSYVAPCIASRVGSATIKLGRLLAPHVTTHGMDLLQKALGNSSTNTRNNNHKLEGMVALATSALTTVSALRNQTAAPEKSLEPNLKNKKKDHIKIKKEP